MLALLVALALAQDPDAPDAAVEPPSAACAADISVPGEVWPDRSAEVAGARADAVAALDAYLFPADLDRGDKERRGVRTDGVVIVHGGAIVYERYGGGFTADNRHLIWSATKSFVNALVGVAVGEGRLSIDDPICDHLAVANSESCAVTVRHLLEFSSGWDWRETYEGYSPVNSSVLAMLSGEGSQDMAAFVAGHPLRDPPGTSWMYSSGDTNVLSAVVRRVLEPAHGERYPWAVLLDPIGMSGATWERDGAGTYVGSSYLWATPRDLARFGLLYLHDGCWGGERLLPEGWVEASTTVSDALRRKPLDWEPGDVQGRQFWLNRPVPEIGQVERPWPSVPEDVYAARGHWKQSINVFPSDDLVVVRVADDRDDSFDHDRMLGLARALVEAR